MSWKIRPTIKDHLSSDRNAIVFIDESGVSSLKNIVKARETNAEVMVQERYFLISACLINTEDYGDLKDKVMQLKEKFWPAALFPYKKGEKRVCFHGCDIHTKKGPFSPTHIDYSTFEKDLQALIQDANVTVFSSIIDKEKHVNQYPINPYTPYSLCMQFVLERIAMFLNNKKWSCDIILESRGKTEDFELLQYIDNLLASGTKYVSVEGFRSIHGVYFNPKWCALVNDQKSYWGLELADLIAYSLYRFYTRKSRDLVLDQIHTKLYNYPQIKGYGIKFFP